MDVETLIQIGRLVLAVVCLGLSVVFGLLAAVSMRVLVDLIRAGPAAAEEAFASGASLKNWWNGTHPKATATSSSFVGRRTKDGGVELVEARSRRPSWLR